MKTRSGSRGGQCRTVRVYFILPKSLSRNASHCKAVLRSSGLSSSSLSSWKPSSRSRLNLRSECWMSLDLPSCSCLCVSTTKPTNPSPSSSSNRPPSTPTALYRPPRNRPSDHAEGQRNRAKVREIREPREEECCDMVSSGKYCAYLWRCFR